MARKSRKIKVNQEAVEKNGHEPVYTEKVWNTAIYLRLSVKDTKYEKGSESLLNQRFMLEKYVAEHKDMRLYGIYADNGESGITFERPDFCRLMEDVKSGAVNCIAVKDLSRFGRNYIEAGTYLEQVFPMLGVRFISAAEGFDSLSRTYGNQELMIALKNLINDAYSKDISQKIKSSLKTKQRRGEFIGPFPVYGYMKFLEDKRKIIVDPETAPIVKNIFNWKIEGMANSQIVMRLNNMGIPCPGRYLFEKGILKNDRYAKSMWSQTAVKNIITNKFYLGQMEQGKSRKYLFAGRNTKAVPESEWIITYGSHEAIINEETFYAVSEKKERQPHEE